jgi:hypothetical protein
MPIPRLLPGTLLTLAACTGSPVTESPSSPSTPPASATVPAAPSLARIDQKDGFRTHRFGDALATFPGLQPSPYSTAVLPGVREYELPVAQEQLHVGDTKLQQLHYTFYHGRFYQVSLVARAC